MAIERKNDGSVKLVVSKGTWKQLCSMADVEYDRLMRDGDNVPAIAPRGHRAEPTFWVCAAMMLGNADAMMLAAISVQDPDGEIWFPGLELF